MKLYWHIHHDILFEFATEPIQNSIDYINNCKPMNEVPIRLKLLKPVKGKLPEEVERALVDLNKARAALDKAPPYLVDEALVDWVDKALVDLDKARTNLYKVFKKYEKEINALHVQECEKDCPWDGNTIFSNLD